MNNEQDPIEAEFNQWLNSEEANLIRQTLSDDKRLGKVPHEDLVADKLVQSLLITKPQAELVSRLRYWQIATGVTTAACCIMALSFVSQVWSEPTLEVQSKVPSTKPAILRASRSASSSVRPKLSKAKGKLAAISRRAQFRRYRDFHL